MTVVLCISASAEYSLDRLYVNCSDRLAAEGEDRSSTNPAEAAVGCIALAGVAAAKKIK